MQGGYLVHKARPGMSKDELIGQLGEPHKREIYDATEFLFYNTNWATVSAAGERSPVALVRGRVVGFGQSYYDSYIKARGRWDGVVASSQHEWDATIRPASGYSTGPK